MKNKNFEVDKIVTNEENPVPQKKRLSKKTRLVLGVIMIAIALGALSVAFILQFKPTLLLGNNAQKINFQPSAYSAEGSEFILNPTSDASPASSSSKFKAGDMVSYIYFDTSLRITVDDFIDNSSSTSPIILNVLLQFNDLKMAIIYLEYEKNTGRITMYLRKYMSWGSYKYIYFYDSELRNPWIHKSYKINLELFVVSSSAAVDKYIYSNGFDLGYDMGLKDSASSTETGDMFQNYIIINGIDYNLLNDDGSLSYITSYFNTTYNTVTGQTTTEYFYLYLYYIVIDILGTKKYYGLKPEFTTSQKIFKFVYLGDNLPEMPSYSSPDLISEAETNQFSLEFVNENKHILKIDSLYSYSQIDFCVLKRALSQEFESERIVSAYNDGYFDGQSDSVYRPFEYSESTRKFSIQAYANKIFNPILLWDSYSSFLDCRVMFKRNLLFQGIVVSHWVYGAQKKILEGINWYIAVDVFVSDSALESEYTSSAAQEILKTKSSYYFDVSLYRYTEGGYELSETLYHTYPLSVDASGASGYFSSTHYDLYLPRHTYSSNLYFSLPSLGYVSQDLNLENLKSFSGDLMSFAEFFSLNSVFYYDPSSQKNEAYSNGYQGGYSAGYKDAEGDYQTFDNLLFSIIDSPIAIIRDAFNFTLFGVNISALLLFLLTILLAGWVIKKLI